MHQIASFESPKWKNKTKKLPGVGGRYSLPHSPPLGRFTCHPLPHTHLRKTHILWTYIYFPIHFGIDNIPTNSPKAYTRSLTLSTQNAKTPIPLPTPSPHSVASLARRSSPSCEHVSKLIDRDIIVGEGRRSRTYWIKLTHGSGQFFAGRRPMSTQTILYSTTTFSPEKK